MLLFWKSRSYLIPSYKKYTGPRQIGSSETTRFQGVGQLWFRDSSEARACGSLEPPGLSVFGLLGSIRARLGESPIKDRQDGHVGKPQ
jgi:hypothetical protein